MKLHFSKLLSAFKGDRVLWVVIVFLSIASLLIVYSATGSLAWRQRGGATWSYLFNHMFYMGLGFGVILVMINFIPVSFYSKISPVLLFISVLLLVVSLILSFLNGGTGRTIRLIGSIGFQPSEIAKISTIMFVANILSRSQKDNESRKQAFWWIIGVLGVIGFIIFLSDFSTAVLLGASVFCMMIVGRIPAKYWLGTLGVGIVLLILVVVTADHLPKSIGRVQTMKGRIERFIGISDKAESDPSLFTQNDFAQLAIFKGGTLGVGPGDSEVSNYMAAAYNDFIFAILIEEYGLVGGVFVLFLYLVILYRGGVILKRCDRTFPAFLVVGTTFMIIVQAMINMGVATNLLPNTGQPLPWISLGGTSSVFTAVTFGCILSVSAQNQKDKKAIPAIEERMVNITQEDEEM